MYSARTYYIFIPVIKKISLIQFIYYSFVMLAVKTCITRQNNVFGDLVTNFLYLRSVMKSQQ